MGDVTKDRVQGMLGSANRWNLVSPKAVVSGSDAQAINVLADAIHDIDALWSACQQAAAEIERLNRERAEARDNALEEAAKAADAHAAECRAKMNKKRTDLDLDIFASAATEAESIAAAIRKLKETGK